MASNEPLSTRRTEQPSTLEELGFDYTTLSPRTQVVVQQYANEIKSLMRRTAQDVINIGQRLLEAKEQLGHGRFEAWLRAEFNWGQWTARKFMQVTRQFKSVNFTDLSIEASALYILAAPSTPKVVRQEALERAGQGEAITHAKVKAIASRDRELAKSEADKPFTIDILAENAGWGASTAAKPLPTAQTVDAHSAEIEIQSLFGVGHLLCITNFEQQDHKWLGEVAEVKEATTTDIEVVIKISLQSPTR